MPVKSLTVSHYLRGTATVHADTAVMDRKWLGWEAEYWERLAESAPNERYRTLYLRQGDQLFSARLPALDMLDGLNDSPQSINSRYIEKLTGGKAK